MGRVTGTMILRRCMWWRTGASTGCASAVTGAGGAMPANCDKAAGLIVTCAAAQVGSVATTTMRGKNSFTPEV